MYAFPVFRDVLSTPHGSWDYTSQKDFLALKLLEEIQQEIKVSTKAVRDYVLCSRIWGHFVLGQTFRKIHSEGATETAERVSLQRAGVSKWWRELWETFISQIHFIDPGPVRAELTVVGGLEENEWLLAHMLTPAEPAALTLPPRLWNSLWWLFYQRSCPSPGKLRTGEDDPHFLKAKCSVLISRNELLVTRVNLLRPGRFIVSCRSWTHRTDLYHSVLSHAACLTWTHMHTHGKVYMQWTHLHCSLEQHEKQTGRHVDPWISNNGKMEERIERRRPEKYYQKKGRRKKCKCIISFLVSDNSLTVQPSISSIQKLKGVQYPNNFRLDKINVQFITCAWRIEWQRWKVNVCGWKGHFSYTERSKP